MKMKIIVGNCDGCPFNGECKAWANLSARQRFYLLTGAFNGSFVLKGCPLPEADESEVVFDGNY